MIAKAIWFMMVLDLHSGKEFTTNMFQSRDACVEQVRYWQTTYLRGRCVDDESVAWEGIAGRKP